MNLHKIGELIKVSAPLLGAAVSSINPVAGIAVSLIAKAFNADPTNPDDILSKVSSDPDAAVKLKQLETEHEDILTQAQATEYQASIQDHMDARKREEDIIEKTGRRDWVLDTIAITIVCGFFVMCVMVGMTRFDDADHDVLYMLMGSLTAGFMYVLGYYFGAMNKTQ